MSETTKGSREDRARIELMTTLEACGFNGPQLLERTGLGRLGRAPMFGLMGYIAKGEGHVTGTDIRYAERTMKALGLKPASRKRMIAAFTEGKAWETPQVSDWLRLRGRLQPGLPLRMLMLLTPVCNQERRLSPGRIARWEQVGEALGLSRESVDIVLARFRTKAWITQADPGPAPGPAAFTSACRILGGRASDSLATLKAHYRRKVRQFHPDKLQQEAQSPAVEAAARDRLHELQKAWDTVRKQHPDALR